MAQTLDSLWIQREVSELGHHAIERPVSNKLHKKAQPPCAVADPRELLEEPFLLTACYLMLRGVLSARDSACAMAPTPQNARIPKLF